jgi:hypothetical protein
MIYADFYGETEIDDDELVNDDHQGHLVAEAIRIVNGDSYDHPTVDMLAALITELSWVRALVSELQSHTNEDIPF